MHRKYLRKWSKLPQLGEVYSNKHPVGSITTQETSGLRGYPEGDGEQKKERHSRHWSCCWLLRSAFVFMIISKMTTQQVLPWPPLFSPPVVHRKSSNKWNVFLFFFPNIEYWSGLLRRILTPFPCDHPPLDTVENICQHAVPTVVGDYHFDIRCSFPPLSLSLYLPHFTCHFSLSFLFVSVPLAAFAIWFMHF